MTKWTNHETNEMDHRRRCSSRDACGTSSDDGASGDAKLPPTVRERFGAFGFDVFTIDGAQQKSEPAALVTTRRREARHC
jgi:hypothetical protein